MMRCVTQSINQTNHDTRENNNHKNYKYFVELKPSQRFVRFLFNSTKCTLLTK